MVTMNIGSEMSYVEVANSGAPLLNTKCRVLTLRMEEMTSSLERYCEYGGGVQN
jgi:hypothetical protein